MFADSTAQDGDAPVMSTDCPCLEGNFRQQMYYCMINYKFMIYIGIQDTRHNFTKLSTLLIYDVCSSNL